MLPLSDYQETSRDFLLKTEGVAGLFDEPGVGKTAPTIVAAWRLHVETGLPVLITCPAYLCENWAWEISRFAPAAATVSIANGAGPAARHAGLQDDTSFVITAYSNWSASGKGGGLYTYPELHTRKWAAFIYDEAHRLRGRNSKCTKHVLETRKAKNPNRTTPIWALTGTPIVNNPGDLYPLLHLWDSKDYKSYWRFVGTYCWVNETPWATEVGQLRPGMEQEFQDLLGQFSLRRTLKDVPSLAELEQQDRDYFVSLPASVTKTIKKAREEYVIEHEDLQDSEFVNGGGALYGKLRQLATNPPTAEKPKIDFIRDLLDDRTGHVVVYCWYKASAKAVADGLSKTGRAVTLITGDVPTARRGEMVEKWKKATNPRKGDGILVATISSLKEGISLTNASDVIFLEHSELPADQNQCIARLKRRGQTELVTVHHVWARGTPDMAIKRHLGERHVGLKQALTSWLREPE